MKRVFEFRNKKGAALLYAVMILLFLAMSAVAFTILATTAYQAAARDASRQQSFYYARAVGLAISDQIILDYNMSDIVKALEESEDGEIFGSYSIEKIGLENELMVDGVDNVRFYYPDIDNKKFIYVEVATTYNGATEVVTSVFTCINENDLQGNMFDLFSVYNIYSTSPNDQRFAFATTGTTGVSPSVYLYNGEDQPDATFSVQNNILAEFTSNGTVKIQGDVVRTITGQVTSYGDITLENIIVDGDMTVSGDLFVNKTANNSKVNYNIYIRGNATIKGSNASTVVVGGNIYATGNVKVQNAKVSGGIYGGENCDVTLTTATVGSVNTRGNLTSTSSTVNGNVFTGQTLSLTSSTVLGKVESRGTSNNTIDGSTIGVAASKKSVYCYGNLNLKNNSVIHGNAVVEGTTINTATANISTINGNLTVKKPYASQVGGSDVVLLRGLTVNGSVDIREAAVPAMFSTSAVTTSAYKYEDASSCKVKITGWLFMNADLSLGTADSPTLLNMNGAWLNNVQIGNVSVANGTLKNVKALAARIEGDIIANNIELECVELPATSTVSGRKPSYTGAEGGNVTITGRSGNTATINGKIYSEGNVILGDYSVLPASDTATVRAEANGEIKGADIYGEFIVDNNMIIRGSADLYGNELGKYIYVNGDLAVDASTGTRYAGTPTSTANRIYVYGNTTLYGKLGDLYLMGEDIGDGNKLRILGSGAVNGVTRMLTDLLIIDGNRGGVIMDNPDSIVYFKSNSTITGDQLKVAGTLIIPQSLTISMPNVYANKIITPAIPIVHSDNQDLINKIKALTESSTGVINAAINGNLMTNSTFSTSLNLNGNVSGNLNLSTVTGTVNVTKTISGTLHATNSSSVNLSGTARVDRISAKNVTLSGTSSTRKDIDATGTVTVNSGCTVGIDSTAGTTYTLDAATVTVSGEIRNNIRATGVVTLNSSALAKYNVQASALSISSGTIQGDVKLTSSSATSTISGTIQGNILSSGNISVTSGTLCSSGSKFLKALTLDMSGGSLGANTNIHLTSNLTSVNNYIRATSLNNVRVQKGNLTTIHGAVVNGTLYVGGSLTFASVAPSAAKGLYAGNSTEPLGSGSFSKIDGPVHLPSYKGAPVFADVTGELWAPLVSSLTVTGSVGGKLRSTDVTIHPTTSANRTYGIIDASLLKIYNYTWGTITFNGVITCNTLVVNCDISTYTSVGTEYSPPASSGYLAASIGTWDFVVFKSNVRVDYLNSSYRGNAYIRNATFSPSTLFADGGIYSKYCAYYSYGYVDEYTHASYGASSDGYYKTNYGSFYAGLDATYTNRVHFDYCGIYSNIDIRRSSSTYFKSCIIGLNRNNGDWEDVSTANRKKFSKYYRIVGDTTLDGTRIYGVTDEDSGEHQEAGKIIVHIQSGALTLSNSSSIGWYNSGVGKKTEQPDRGHKSSFDGIYLTNGNLTNNSGCVITVNVFVKGNIVNGGNINLKGNTGYSYCGGYVYWYGSKSGGGWINYDDSPPWYTFHSGGNHGRYGQKSDLSYYTPNGNWQLIATDYTTGTGNTTLGTIVNIPGSLVTSYNSSYFTVPSYTVSDIAAISFSAAPVISFVSEPEEMKQASYGGLAPEIPVLSSGIQTIMGSITPMNPAALPDEVKSTDDWNPLAIPVKWYEPTSTVAGETVTLNNRTNNLLSVKVENIGLVGGSVSGKLGLYAVDAARYKYASNKINDIMNTKGGHDMILYTKTFDDPGSIWPWDTTKRQVGAFFFESGIVPSSVFDATYREDSDKEGGRYLWGREGILGSGGDCVWTFFTCSDPKNPYTSPAKDLHIILPANVGMQWSKDKDNALNIIGNGRVFLYLRSGTNIRVVGNGFANWISGIFGGSSNNTFGTLRYADPNTGVVNDNPVTGRRQPRLFLVGVGGSIYFEVYDFQTFAYVYMPRGYSYSGKTLNEFKITASDGFFSGGAGSGDWDIIGMYVTDKFSYTNSAGAKVNYYKTVPDLSNTVINTKTYRLSQFWDYPEDLPTAGLAWKYKGIVVKQ